MGEIRCGQSQRLTCNEERMEVVRADHIRRNKVSFCSLPRLVLRGSCRKLRHFELLAVAWPRKKEAMIPGSQ